LVAASAFAAVVAAAAAPTPAAKRAVAGETTIPTVQTAIRAVQVAIEGLG
jgi:hypothetical protein